MVVCTALYGDIAQIGNGTAEGITGAGGLSIVIFESRICGKVINGTVCGIIDSTAGSSRCSNNVVTETAGNILIVTKINRITCSQKVEITVIVYGTALCGGTDRGFFLTGGIAIKSERAAQIGFSI